MTILVDTGVFVAFSNKRDPKHNEALKILKNVAENKYGTPYASDYIFDETVTTTLARTGRLDLAINLGKMILEGPERPFMIILRITENLFADAWANFMKYGKRGLSFTDCTSLALMSEREIEKIASFDAGFDGLTNRLHKAE
jgi:uncharacterized protein